MLTFSLCSDLNDIKIKKHENKFKKRKTMNRWLFFYKPLKRWILNERKNKTQIRQHLAFQYGIYAVKCGTYPFINT